MTVRWLSFEVKVVDGFLMNSVSQVWVWRLVFVQDERVDDGETGALKQGLHFKSLSKGSESIVSPRSKYSWRPCRPKLTPSSRGRMSFHPNTPEVEVEVELSSHPCFDTRLTCPLAI